MTTLCSDSNAVLKLDLGEEGGIRRIALKKLWDESIQNVSYQRLSELALKFYHSSHALPKGTENASVTVTYTDEDGDIITISTNDELAEAFAQFIHQVPPVLRATASLRGKPKKKAKVESSSTATPKKEKVAKKEKSTKKQEEKKVKSSSTTDDLQNVLENFVGVLTVAVNTLTRNVPKSKEPEKKEIPKNHESGPVASPAAKDNTSTTTNTTNVASKTTTTSNPTQESVKKATMEKLMKEVVEKMTKKNEQATSADPIPVPTHKNMVDAEPKVEPLDASSTPHVPDSFDRSFIHGRHTCDSCLVTPIIGIRFNATNLPDYDLCEKCVSNYKGSEITFAPAQLERDVQLQTRWRRRHARACRQIEINNKKNSQNSCENLSLVAPEYPDQALKEAIRRSLLDANQKRVPSPPSSTDTSATCKDNVDKSSDVEERAEKEPKIVVEKGSEENTEVVPKETKVSMEVVPSEVEAPIEVVPKETEAPVEDVSESEEKKVVGEEKESVAEAEDIETDTESSTSLTSEPEVVKVEEQSVCDEEAEKINTSTFSEDAEGKGDVAAAIGHALDSCAEAIDAMVEEVDKEVSVKDKASDENITREDGQTIIEGTPDDVQGESSKSEESDDEGWQVLDSVSSDEMIAQAAQLLGSALFQSDMAESTNDSTLEKSQTSSGATSKSSSMSTISVPSTVPSIATKSEISSVLLSRWDDELRQLHELGFYDDHSSIDALEHLEAANMGVESNDPVTVCRAQ